MHLKRQHKTLLKPFLPMALAALLQLSLYSSCQPAQSDIRSEQDIENFFNTANGILKTDSATIAHCDSIIANTTDSVTYYDYSLMKAMSNVLSFKPREVLPITERARNHVAGMKESRYTRSILGMCSSIEALHNFMLKRDADTVIALNRNAYELLMQSDMIKLTADVAANIADAYISDDNMTAGARWYRRALFLADSLNIPDERNGRLYTGLGRIYSYMLDNSSACQFFEKAEPYYEDMTLSMKSHHLHYYGRCYIYMGDYDNALKTFMRQRDMLTSHGKERIPDMYLCKLNLADVYLNRYDSDSAEMYVKEAEPFFRAMHIDHGMYYCNTVKIGIATVRKNYAEVGRILNSEEKNLRGITQTLKNIRSHYLEEYYIATGQYLKAYRHLDNNSRQNDSLKRSLAGMRSNDIMERFTEDTLRMHHQIEISERDIVANRHLTLVWVFAFLIFCLLGAITYIVSHQRRHSLQTNIEMLKLRLSNSRQRISPHFIFNVLNSRMSGASKEETNTLLRLAKLIRRNLDLTSKGCVSLQEELDFVKRYVDLEGVLLGNDFKFITDLPSKKEVLQGIQVPAMFVQILVENAIKHGLRPLSRAKRLELKVRVSDDATDIDVTDNGNGFDIRSMEEKSVKNGLHIIRQTIAIINQNNKPESHIRHAITNITDESGNITGCRSSLHIPRTTKML